MSRRYVGPSELHGIDFLLTVDEDGTHEMRTRPIGAPWQSWSPPVVLIPESAEIDEAVT